MSWSQTEIEGISAAALDLIETGAVWRWTGDLVRLDGPASLLRLPEALGRTQLRRRAGQMAQRLLAGAGTANTPQPRQDGTFQAAFEPTFKHSFCVTDGRQRFEIGLVMREEGVTPVAVFQDAIPPKDCDLWVLEGSFVAPKAEAQEAQQTLPWFALGTLIQTPVGPRSVETLHAGDLIETKDSGPQPIWWTGQQNLHGDGLANTAQMPTICIDPQAFGKAGSVVQLSPDHCLLLGGHAVQRLFCDPEVLVRVKDLLGHPGVWASKSQEIDSNAFIMLQNPEMIFANGLEVHCLHTGDAPRSLRAFAALTHLVEVLPQTGSHRAYDRGPPRRVLTAGEAAILVYGMKRSGSPH
ncbi:MAG: Hint domain-containing protein [Pseudomonadota bacterium]